MKYYYKKLLCLATVVVLTACQSSPEKVTNELAYESFLIGSMSEDKGAGIHQVTFITDLTDHTAQLRYEGVVATLPSPSYMVHDQHSGHYYAVSGRANSGIKQLTWQAEKNKFKQTAQLNDLGSGACHISRHPSGKRLAIANYRSGEVFEIALDDQQLVKKHQFKNIGHGPHQYQKSPHMHYVEWDKSGRYLYAVDLGTDEIKYFDHKEDDFTDRLAIKLQPGDGPRHLTFHPNNDLVYVLNELSNSVVVLATEQDGPRLTQVQRLTTLPANATGYNASSAIKISEDGKFLYAGVRGVNVIMVYAIDDTGQLSYLQEVSVGGNWPRDFAFNEGENFLLVANQRSNQLNVLMRDIDTGLLTPTSLNVSIPEASYITRFNP